LRTFRHTQWSQEIPVIGDIVRSVRCQTLCYVVQDSERTGRTRERKMTTDRDGLITWQETEIVLTLATLD